MSQGVDRGWFSYMDLMVLIEGGDFARAIRQVLSEVCKVGKIFVMTSQILISNSRLSE